MDTLEFTKLSIMTVIAVYMLYLSINLESNKKES